MEPISIMLVDDNPAFLRATNQFLDAHEDLSVVGTAGGGDEALELVHNLQPQIILVDLAMIGLSGLEAIPQLRSTLPDTGIIALTLMNTNHFRKAALKAGADDFVPKSTMRTALVPAIRQLARNGRKPKEEPTVTISHNRAVSEPHILVIEDDTHLCRLYRKALEGSGYKVRIATTVPQARLILNNARFDVLLCDIHMGEDHGTDLLREYSATLATNGTQVIMVSGQAQYRAMCEEMGADFFMEKPVSIGTLVSLVDRITARGSI